MIVPSEYEQLFSRIIEPSVFIADKWYKMPKDVFTTSFLQWYSKNTYCLEFSENKTHFKVIGYPAKYIKSFYFDKDKK